MPSLSIVQPLRLAARSLRRSPAFAVTAIVVLALGIGANGAMFSLLDAAIIRPLPFRRSDRLVMLSERTPSGHRNRVSPLNFLDWSEQQHGFASMAAVAGGSRTMIDDRGAAERIPGQAVTAQFFDVLGVTPIAGRTFDADVARDPHVVVISERLWRGRFGSDPGLVGRPVILEGEPFTVIGIVPASFDILYRADVWTPFVPRRSPEQRRQHYMQVIARLRDGVSMDAARADMDRVAAAIAQISPETNKDWGVTIDPLRAIIVGDDLRTTSIVLAGIVGAVLLIACANVANLLLARGLDRSREIAIRAAIGASRRRIVGDLLAEALLLAVAGGAGGIGLTWAAVRGAPRWLPSGALPPSIVLTIDPLVLAFTALATALTALGCGLAPAWQSSNATLSSAATAGGRAATRASGTARSMLVATEIAAAVVVVTSAGLLGRTLQALTDRDHGFRGDHVITGSIGLSFTGYNDAGRMDGFYQKAERELASIPGVAVAAFSQTLPLEGWNIGQGFEVIGDAPIEQSRTPAAHYQIVSASYFRALGIDIVRGRPFDDHDTASAAQVCIVNEEFARRFLHGRDPIGARLNVQSMDLRGGPTPVEREIVGVSRQVTVTMGEKEPAVEIYVPIRQNPWFSAAIALRTIGDPAAFGPAMKAAIARVDPNEPVSRIRTMAEIADEAAAQPRFRALFVGVFAAVAVGLAAVGIFGVAAYTVARRAREFGIRSALGATTGHLMRLVLAGGARTAVVGVAIGLGGSAVVSRLLATLLFGVSPLDPVTFAATAGALTAVALAACAIPAWHATRVDPAVVLRQE